MSRPEPPGPAAPRVLVVDDEPGTAHVDVAAIERALQHGRVHALVIKPWTRAELTAAIEHELTKRA